MSLTPNGNIRYQLKTPYRDGTTPVIFEPLDFIARLAALVPRPRVNLTRFHGVFAPNSKHRALVTPAKRGKGSKPKVPNEAQHQTPAERRAGAACPAQRVGLAGQAGIHGFTRPGCRPDRAGQGGLRPVGRSTAVVKRKRLSNTGGKGPGAACRRPERGDSGAGMPA